MSEPEKYTLPRVRDIVLSHAAKIGMASEALGATEGKDPEVLAMLSERALKAADALFGIENVRGVQGHDAVTEFGDEDLWHAIDGLPTLVMAMDAACADPHAMCSVCERWWWCQVEASRISSGLIDWAVALEKDVGKPKENGVGAQPVSQPDVPKEESAGGTREPIGGDEPVTQWEIHHETRNHLRLIEPLLERIGSGSGSQVGAGYVEMDSETDERFTDLGWGTVTALRTVALGSTRHLWDVSGETTGQVDARLLNDVQGFLAVLACALSGMDRDAQMGAHPPWVATGLLHMLRALQERVEAEQEPERGSPPQEKEVAQ